MGERMGEKHHALKLEEKLRPRVIRIQGKTYTYLYVPIAKQIIQTLNPEYAFVSIGNFGFRLRIKKWRKVSYVIIPRKVAELLKLKPGDLISVELILDSGGQK